MTMEQNNNPLHGITLENMLNELVARYGWEKLGKQITIRCFQQDPCVSSSLKFLRKTPWARAKVEALYLKATRSRTKDRATPKTGAKPRPERTARTLQSEPVLDSASDPEQANLE